MEAGKSMIKMLADPVLLRSTFVIVGVFSLGPHMEEGERGDFLGLFIRTLNSSMRTQPS